LNNGNRNILTVVNGNENDVDFKTEIIDDTNDILQAYKNVNIFTDS